MMTFEIHIDARVLKPLALTAGAALLLATGWAIAAPGDQVTQYTDGDALTASGLNDRFNEVTTQTGELAAGLGALMDYPAEGTEVQVGTWIDGKPIYRRVVSFTGGPNNNVVTHPHGASIQTLVGMRAILNGGNFRSVLPFIDGPTGGGASPISLTLQGTNLSDIAMESAKNWSGISGFVILEYTKP